MLGYIYSPKLLDPSSKIVFLDACELYTCGPLFAPPRSHNPARIRTRTRSPSQEEVWEWVTMADRWSGVFSHDSYPSLRRMMGMLRVRVGRGEGGEG